MSQVARWIYPNERSGVHVSGPGRMKGKVIEETRKPERETSEVSANVIKHF